MKVSFEAVGLNNVRGEFCHSFDYWVRLDQEAMLKELVAKYEVRGETVVEAPDVPAHSGMRHCYHFWLLQWGRQNP